MSNPNVSAGDNKVFVSNFVSSEWSGELRSLQMNIETGAIEPPEDDYITCRV